MITLNLIPENYNFNKCHDVKKYERIVLVFLIFLAIVMIIAGQYFHYLAEDKQAQYYSKFVFKQQQILQYNNQIKQTKETISNIRKTLNSQTHWTPLLITMAETKPIGIKVNSVRIKKDRIYVDTLAENESVARDWQNTLSKAGFFDTINIIKVNRIKKAIAIEYEIKVVKSNAKKKPT